MFEDIGSKVQKKLGLYLGQDGLQVLSLPVNLHTSTNEYMVL